jgi:hypothetical protein
MMRLILFAFKGSLEHNIKFNEEITSRAFQQNNNSNLSIIGLENIFRDQFAVERLLEANVAQMKKIL